jgi:iron(III) transport system ATP-binding protein
MTERHVLRCEGVSKAYGSVTALDELELVLEQAAILALVGPSGCGKSTLLRLIAGFDRPDRGSISMEGVVLSGTDVLIPPRKRRFGMVFQDYALFPHLTVEENISFGVSGADAETRPLMAQVGLAGLERKYPHELSGGQQQRVALARSIAARPRLLLLDEPFSNLDPQLRHRIRGEVKEILQATRTRSIFVTHDEEEALFMGDIVAVMNQGRIIQIGTPYEIFQKPQSRFVARFMGPADFLPGKITSTGLATEAGTLPIPTGLNGDRRFEVMVRPDDVAIVPAGEPQEGLASGRIVRKEFRGMHFLYAIELPSGGTLHSLQVHYADFAVGDWVGVRLDPRHPLRIFSGETAIEAIT